MRADLHNHNHSRSFLWLSAKERKFRRKKKFHPWTIVVFNKKALRKGRMASAYGQSDLVKLWNGEVKLTFNALYPIEKGFFNSDPFKGSGPFINRVIRFLANKHLPIRDVLQMVVMRLPDATIDYIQSNQYSYWEELNREYAFCISKDGIRTRNSLLTPGLFRRIFENERRRRRRYSSRLDATGKYIIPKSTQQLEATLERPNETITMVLTIEGAHAFGTDKGKIQNWLAHVDHVKRNWDHPVFFVTFSHHFNNKLCGHAHSFPDVASKIMDQTDEMNEGFTSDGRKMIRKLLAITEDNNPDSNEPYRMLIDVKHMSAKGRKEYYNEIVAPCFDKGDVIPVIASHVGHSGRKSLQDLIDYQGREKDDSFEPTGVLNNWNINICDEDVKWVFKTEGLIGLSMDQRIMGVPKSQKETGGRNTIDAIWNNLKAILEPIYTDPDVANKDRIWNCICLGSDFEGYIDPINEFKTALEYQALGEQLITKLEEERVQNGGSIFGMHTIKDVKNNVKRIAIENAKAFVIKHYPV